MRVAPECAPGRGRFVLATFAAFFLPSVAWTAIVPLLVTENVVWDWSLAHRPDGSLTLAWVEAPLGSVQSQASIRHFSATGVPLDAPTTISSDSGVTTLVDIAADALGNELLVLRRDIASSSGARNEVRAVALSAAGAELWPAVVLGTTAEGFDYFGDVDVVAAPGGGWIVVWEEYRADDSPQFRVISRHVALATGQATSPVELGGSEGLLRDGLSLASDGAQPLAVWREQQPGPSDVRLVGRTLNALGAPNGGLVDLARLVGVEPPTSSLDLRAWAAGRYFLSWSQLVGSGEVQVRGVSYSPGGAAAPPVELARHPGWDYGFGSAVAVDRRGRAVVAWYESPAGTQLPSTIVRQDRVVSGGPLSEPVAVTSLDTEVRSLASSISPTGAWVIAWSQARPNPLQFPAAVVAEFGTVQGGCESSGMALCLAGGRFLATATFHDHLGRDGVGQAVALSPESGTFWFFTPANVELIVKVVDACGHPDFGDFWVYASGLTDVEVTLTVVDTWTGEVWERETDLGEPFPPILDSQAFHTCDAAPITGPIAARDVGR